MLLFLVEHWVVSSDLRYLDKLHLNLIDFYYSQKGFLGILRAMLVAPVAPLLSVLVEINERYT